MSMSAAGPAARDEAPRPAGLTDSAFVRACRRRPVPHTPVWFMRQAGRSLPEYRQIRTGVPMLESCRRPDLVTEITLQPVRRHGVDAAILFSDIVVPLKAIGVDLDIVPGVGPVVAQPFGTRADLDRLPDLTVADVPYVDEAVRLLVAELGTTPLIGFAGAPFTLASYLVEGGPSRNHEHTKAMAPLGIVRVVGSPLTRPTRCTSLAGAARVVVMPASVALPPRGAEGLGSVSVDSSRSSLNDVDALDRRAPGLPALTLTLLTLLAGCLVVLGELDRLVGMALARDGYSASVTAAESPRLPLPFPVAESRPWLTLHQVGEAAHPFVGAYLVVDALMALVYGTVLWRVTRRVRDSSLRHLPSPEKRQTLFFSATMPPQIRRIAKKYLTDAAEITVKSRTTTTASVCSGVWVMGSMVVRNKNVF